MISDDQSIEIVSDSAFTLSGVDSLRYSPNSDYNGSETWNWNWSDGESFATSPGEVTVTILPTADDPTVSPISGSGTTDETIPLSEIVFQEAFSNPDGGGLEVIEISSVPSEGELLVADSLLEIGDQLSLSLEFQIVYAPDGGFTGNDSWNWIANPDQENVVGTVTYSVDLPNQGPVAVDIDTVIQEDTPIDFPIDLFTESATDPEGDDIDRIVFTDIPQNGVWTFGDLFGDTLQENLVYTLSDISLISYLPKAHFWGDEEIDFQLIDIEGNSSNTATFKLVVEEVNDPPGRFQIIDLDDDTLRWSGQVFTVRWNEAEEVDVGDTITYTWFVNLRDTLIEVEAKENLAINVALDQVFLEDADVFLMWVEASDGEDISRSPNKIFKVVNPAVTGLVDHFVSNLQVYPNPAVRHVRVEKPADLFSSPTLRLYNSLGQLVGTWVPAYDMSDSMDLTLPNLITSGWYTLELSGINANGSMMTWQNKLMIQYP
ncbi:MAG: Ig-like domain-containing protein [Bacteroidota bacterium]